MLSSAFASFGRVREAHDQILGFCDASIGGHTRFQYETESLGFMGDGPSKHTLADFLGFVEVAPGIARYRPALSCNVYASAQARRASATSARSCSAARSRFF